MLQALAAKNWALERGDWYGALATLACPAIGIYNPIYKRSAYNYDQQFKKHPGRLVFLYFLVIRWPLVALLSSDQKV